MTKINHQRPVLKKEYGHRRPQTKKDERDRQYLYVEATGLANRQEDFFEQNGNKWAE